jgi:hypothetical protein
LKEINLTKGKQSMTLTTTDKDEIGTRIARVGSGQLVLDITSSRLDKTITVSLWKDEALALIASMVSLVKALD